MPAAGGWPGMAALVVVVASPVALDDPLAPMRSVAAPAGVVSDEAVDTVVTEGFSSPDPDSAMATPAPPNTTTTAVITIDLRLLLRIPFMCLMPFGGIRPVRV